MVSINNCGTGHFNFGDKGGVLPWPDRDTSDDPESPNLNLNPGYRETIIRDSNQAHTVRPTYDGDRVTGMEICHPSGSHMGPDGTEINFRRIMAAGTKQQLHRAVEATGGKVVLVEE